MSFFLFTGGLITLTVCSVLFLFRLVQVLESLAAAYPIDPEVILHLNKTINIAIIITVLVAAFLGALAFLLGIALTHKVFGPMVQIERALKRLADGDYKARGALRKNDEFHEIMDSINELATKLEERHGGEVSTPPTPEAVQN